MPTVVGKVNDHIRKTQFKRAYTLLASAVQKLEEDKGYIQCNYGANGSWIGCKDFIRDIGEYLKPIKFCPNKAVENGCFPNPPYRGGEVIYAENNPDSDYDYIGNCGYYGSTAIYNNSPAYVLSDGIILFFYATAGGTFGPIVIVDINGFDNPNKWGYDVFTFSLKRQSISSGLELKPSPTGCAPIEKGGKSSLNFFLSI